jgi:hypothetical protein
MDLRLFNSLEEAYQELANHPELAALRERIFEVLNLAVNEQIAQEESQNG